MPKTNRDDFPEKVRDALAKRAGYICSNPECRRSTTAPSTALPLAFSYLGIAAHITAAAPGGPRYDPNLSPEVRRSIANGIHLCQICARLIDTNNGADHPDTLLYEWKEKHEEWIRRGGPGSQPNTAQPGRNALSSVQELALPGIAIDQSIEGTLSPLLDDIRAALEERRPKEALRRLAEFRKHYWHTADKRLRARITFYQGNAHYALEQLDEASQRYLEAYGEANDEEYTNSHVALAYLISGDRVQAEQRARNTLDRFPSSTLGAAVLLHAVSPTDIASFLHASIPSPIHGAVDVLLNCAILARHKGNLTESERWARQAIRKDKLDHPTLWAVLGEILYAQAFSLLQVTQATVRQVQRSDEARRLLAQAEEAFTAAWDKVANTEVRESRVQWLVNRAAIRQLIGMAEAAKNDFDEVLRIVPDLPEALRARANIAFGEGMVDLGLSLLRRAALPIRAGHAEVALMLVEALLIQRGTSPDLLEARGLLNTLANEIEAPGLQEATAVLSVRLEVEAGDEAAARALASDLLQRYPNSLKSLLAVAHACANGGPLAVREEPEELCGLLDRALAQVNSVTTDAERVELGQLLYEAERFRDAAVVLEPVAIPGAMDVVARRIIFTLYRAGKRGRARDLAHAAIERHGPMPFFSEMLAAISSEIGDLSTAASVAAAYVDKYPNDLGMRLRLASIRVRQGNEEAIEKLLEGHLDITAARPNEATVLVDLLERLNRMDDALCLAYEIRQRFFSVPEAHLRYIRFFLLPGRRKLPGIVNAPSTVSVNSYVTVAYDNGTERGYWIEEKPFRAGPEYLSPDHPLAKMLMGRQVGEVVTLPGPSSVDEAFRQKIRVKSVYSIYFRAFEESRDHLEEWFPDIANSFFTLSVAKPKAADTEPLEYDFTPLFQMIDAHHERRQQIEEHYSGQFLPLPTVAQMAGRDIWTTWRAFARDPRMHIRCCPGDRDEFNDAIALTKASGSMVADPVALLTLFHLPCRQNVLEIIGSLVVPQSVIDEFRKIADEHDAEQERRVAHVVRQGDGYIYHEMLPEHMLADREETASLLRWVLDNTEVRPLGLLLDADDEDELKEFRSTLGEAFADPILLARELGQPLYTDDLALREFGRVEHGVRSVWTAALLQHAFDCSQLLEQDFEDARIRLVSWHYEFTSIEPSTILRAAELSKWLPQGEFASVVATLHGDRSDKSSVGVGADAMLLVARTVTTRMNRALLTDAILDAVMHKRSRATAFQQVKQRVEAGMKVWCPQYQDLVNQIETWELNRVI